MLKIHLSRLQFFYLLIALFSVAYVVIRAYVVGVTYDEAWTINSFVPLDFIDILNNTYPDANNQILNTLLIKVLYLFDNDSLFLARLPNVFAFCLYVLYAYKLSYKYLTKFVGIGCFLLLLLNPFVLDFFGLARGYGLALGFEMTALYFTIKYFHSAKVKHSLIALILSALAVLSNFTFLNFYLVLLIVLILITFSLRSKVYYLNYLLSFIIVTSILGVLIYEPIQNLRAAGSLYYGGESFYSDTLLSLTSYSMYDQNEDTITFVVLNCFVLLFLAVLAFSYRKGLRFSVKNIFVLLLLGCILSLVFQNLLFDTLYLINRTALLFYPIIIFTLVFSLKELSKSYFSKSIMSLLLVAFTLNFFANANFRKTATWYFDSHTQEILEKFNDKGKNKGEALVIEYSWPFRSSIGYYLQKNEYPYVKSVEFLQNGDSINKPADYYIYLDESLGNVGYFSDRDDIKKMEKTVEKRYPEEKIIIYSLETN